MPVARESADFVAKERQVEECGRPDHVFKNVPALSELVIMEVEEL